MKSGTPRPVADLLAGALPQLAERLLEYRIRKSWVSLVGPEIARRTRPQSLVNGCLTVVVDNSPWLSELTLRAPELTARLAGAVPGVRSMRLALGALERDPEPAPEPGARPASLGAEDRREIDAATATIRDPALAEAAKRLLTAARRSPSPRGAGG